MIILYLAFKMKSVGPTIIDEVKILTMKLCGIPGDI
jgi:hypothetical protein